MLGLELESLRQDSRSASEIACFLLDLTNKKAFLKQNT